MKHCFPYLQGITRGFGENIALRKRYQKEGFGLETVFERQEWADGRATELKQIYEHISTSETGEKPTWGFMSKLEKDYQFFSRNLAAVVRNKKVLRGDHE